MTNLTAYNQTAYNQIACQQADQVIHSVCGALLGSLSHQQADVLKAPAGAGKSYAVCTVVQQIMQMDARVAVVTPTNEQAFSLVANLADRLPGQNIGYLPASSVQLPAWAHRPNVRVLDANHANSVNILVGTLNKLGDAHCRGKLQRFDLLVMDEAYQADSIRYFAVADLADRHLLVGDPGQLDPFTTLPDPDRWRGWQEDPLQTAVGALLRYHPQTPVYQLPITRRLDPRAISLVQSFYPGHPFQAAVQTGIRSLQLQPALHSTIVDMALDHGCQHGWAYLELPAANVLPADPETIQLISTLADRLLQRQPTVFCEQVPHGRPLRATDIAIAVSHNDQKNHLRYQLQSLGLADVIVDTANKLQGRTFEVVIAWHPLAGLVEADNFHLEAGRLCVMLTRHRQACFVVGRSGDRHLLSGPPPAAPAYLNYDQEPLLDGWQLHQAIFNHLIPHQIIV
uniref:DNA2/NAM7 helicase-like C-terminal domain-containing protein n=1 Tax=Cyanothece sp. (strain PCC 7425 / ATCC 29141) TaxID=395961 RepID=B8HYY0_CYAP4